MFTQMERMSLKIVIMSEVIHLNHLLEMVEKLEWEQNHNTENKKMH
jgi:hypothetical protein